MNKRVLARLSVLLVSFLVLLLATACSEVAPVENETENSRYVDIEYRETPVNLAADSFEYLNTADSSFVRGAWYDQGNRYLVLNLDGVYYHYCGVPGSVWTNLKTAESAGGFYQQSIKGRYDCRNGHVPHY